jgi:NAD-dependent dihydropyrimidine dehydrogenase PreA subunit
LNEVSGCYRKPLPSSLRVGGLEVGISGLPAIIEKGLEHMDAPDDVQRSVLLSELKARNYVPPSVEDEYLKALWAEYRKFRLQRRDEREESYRGIPREEIPWYPSVDQRLCSGCSSCVEFCAQGVFHFAEGKSHVVRPYNCIVGRSSCRSFCPEKAISFPTHTLLRETLSRLREEHGLPTRGREH